MNDIEAYQYIFINYQNELEKKNTQTQACISCVDEEKCLHKISFQENGITICADCGQWLNENHLIVQNEFGMQIRKKNECNLYNEIPFFVSQKTKNLAVEIYKFVSNNDIYRNKFRKAILLACLQRACVICQEPISFEDLLEMINLKTHEASKGINYVAERLPKNSIYEIPFLNDEMSIFSIMNNLGIKNHINNVYNIFYIVKNNSDILNISQYKSVVCGCIFFWIKINSLHFSLRQFANKVKMSEMTIVKKYIIITEEILKAVIKKLLCELLQKCKPINLEKIDLKSSSEEDLIEKKHYKLHFYKNFNKFKVTDYKNIYELPIDYSVDIKEWNDLFNTVYYNYLGQELILSIKINVTNRDIIFDFKKYNEINNVNGKNILKEIITEKTSENNFISK